MKNRARVYAWAFVFWLVLVGGLFARDSGVTAESDEFQVGTVVTFAAGQPGWVYHDIGQWTAKLAAERGITVRTIETNGSLANLLLVSDRTAVVGLSQLDAIVKFVHQDTTLRVTRALYTEYLHIILREAYTLLDESQFEGKRIFIGQDSSGTSVTAGLFLNLFGISSTEYIGSDVADFEEVARLMDSDSLDVCMQVEAMGSQTVKDLIEKTDTRLYSIPPDAISRITMENPTGALSVHTIPVGTYPWQRRDVSAVTVPVMMVTHEDVHPELVALIDSLVVQAVDTMRALGYQGNLALLEAAWELPGTIKRHRGVNVEPPVPWLFWANIAGALIVFGTGAVYIRRNLPTILRICRNRAIPVVLALAVVLCLLGSVGIYWLEHSVNDNFGTLYESVWSMMVYLTSGLEDRVPITTGGRVLASLLLMMGAVLGIIITGLFTSSLVTKAWGKTMFKDMSNHFVVLNWNSRTVDILRQIQSPVWRDDDQAQVIVVSDDPSINLNKLQERFGEGTSRYAFKRVFFFAGDPCDPDSLEAANALGARSIIIMADERLTVEGVGGADEKSLRSLLAVQQIAEDNKSRLPVAIELIDAQNRSIVDQLRRKFPGTVDVVAADHVRTLLLAQAAIIHGLTDFYRDLLQFEADSNELYLIRVPDSAAGKPFAEYSAEVIRYRPEQPIIPVGLSRGENSTSILASNPKPLDEDGAENPMARIEKGDELLVMAYERPDPGDLPG